jgi:nucleoside-triphosphatase
VARRLLALAAQAGVDTAGFVTEEIREHGRRVGFGLQTTGGEQGILAHVDLPGPPRVGRYGVDLEALEALAIPALESAAEAGLVVVDELGKMELASQRFRDAVSVVLEAPVPVVATAQASRHPFTDRLKRRRDVETLRLTAANRDGLAEELARRVRDTAAGRPRR